MNENITAVKLKENISKTANFFTVPGAGTFELKSFHVAGHLTSKSLHLVRCKQPEPQAAQALSIKHRNITTWRLIIRVCMGFSTRHLWRQLKVTYLNKNGLPYAIRVLFAPGGVIIPI